MAYSKGSGESQVLRQLGSSGPLPGALSCHLILVFLHSPVIAFIAIRFHFHTDKKKDLKYFNL